MSVSQSLACQIGTCTRRRWPRPYWPAPVATAWSLSRSSFSGRIVKLT